MIELNPSVPFAAHGNSLRSSCGSPRQKPNFLDPYLYLSTYLLPNCTSWYLISKSMLYGNYLPTYLPTYLSYLRTAVPAVCSTVELHVLLLRSRRLGVSCFFFLFTDPVQPPGGRGEGSKKGIKTEDCIMFFCCAKNRLFSQSSPCTPRASFTEKYRYATGNHPSTIPVRLPVMYR